MVLHTNLRELYCENMKFTNINRKLYQLICMCWILSDWLVKYGKTVKKLKMKRKSPFVLVLMTTAFSVLRFTASDYPSDIFKLFLFLSVHFLLLIFYMLFLIFYFLRKGKVGIAKIKVDNRKLYRLICMCWILSDWLVKYGKTVKKLKMKRKSEISKRKQGMRNYGSTEAY
jgi:hypothetical protein